METNKVGRTIAFLRKQMGMTQHDLADKIGISDKAVSKWERGLSLPDVSYISTLAATLDTDAESILLGNIAHCENRWRGFLFLGEHSAVNAMTLLYGKPLVYILLSYFLLAGIRNISIFCGRCDEDSIREKLDDGKRLGAVLEYLPDTCDEVLDRLDMIQDENLMVVDRPIYVNGAGITKCFQRAMQDPNRITVISSPTLERNMGSEISFNKPRATTDRICEGIAIARYDYSLLPIVFMPSTLFPREYHKEHSRIDIFNGLLNEQVYKLPLDRGLLVSNICTFDDVIEVASNMRLVEKTSGLQPFCIEEIAWRRGMISFDEFEQLGENSPDEELRRYISALCYYRRQKESRYEEATR